MEIPIMPFCPAPSDPLAGEPTSQPIGSDAVHPNVPVPVLLMVMPCPGGFDPCSAVKEREVGDTLNTGAAGGGVTVSVTSTMRGDPVAPAAVKVIAPVYVPGV